jgi:hypothetical protein
LISRRSEATADDYSARLGLLGHRYLHGQDSGLVVGFEAVDVQGVPKEQPDV